MGKIVQMAHRGPDWSDRMNELDEHQRNLVEQLVFERRCHMTGGRWKEAGFEYHGMPDFLLRHGTWYSPEPWKMFPYRKGTPKVCFANSVVLAGHYPQLRYVEGVALAHQLPISTHHAWNTNRGQQLIDTTWQNEGSAYLGVEFPFEEAYKVLKPGKATMLDNYIDRFELFREPFIPRF